MRPGMELPTEECAGLAACFGVPAGTRWPRGHALAFGAASCAAPAADARAVLCLMVEAVTGRNGPPHASWQNVR